MHPLNAAELLWHHRKPIIDFGTLTYTALAAAKELRGKNRLVVPALVYHARQAGGPVAGARAEIIYTLIFTLLVTVGMWIGTGLILYKEASAVGNTNVFSLGRWEWSIVLPAIITTWFCYAFFQERRRLLNNPNLAARFPATPRLIIPGSRGALLQASLALAKIYSILHTLILGLLIFASTFK